MRDVVVMVVVVVMVMMVVMMVVRRRNLCQRGASHQNGGNGDGEQIFQHSNLLIHDGRSGPT